MIDVEQRAMVGVEVRTYLGMDARRALALVAKVEVLSVHGVHICRRSAKVAQIAFEIRELSDDFHFFDDAFLAA